MEKELFMQSLFIGVDGGATKCIVRIEDQAGNLLGRETRGPANIRISVDRAWDAINSALEAILKPLNIRLGDAGYHWHAGMGLAGCEMPDAYQTFLNHAHFFQTLIVASDAHAACLGAHGGKDGAIIIVGTGVVGFELSSGRTLKIGGYGFPHDDLGGGASLGLEAVKLTLQSLDGRVSSSALTNAVFAHFANDKNRLIAWANQANSTAFAELAPFVIEHSKAGDASAIQLMQQAGKSINQIDQALIAAQSDKKIALPLALIGGISPFIVPYVSDALRARLVASAASPDAGAVILVRNHLENTHSNREAAHG